MVWDKLAPKYDRIWLQKYSLTPTREKIHSLMEETLQSLPCPMIEPPPPLCILDVGCGTGQLVEEIYRKYSGFHRPLVVVALDKSKEMLQIAQRKSVNTPIIFQEYKMGEDSVEKIQQHLPQGIKYFDVITCCHSFPYYQQKKQVLQQINSLLSPMGTAFFFQGSVNTFYDKVAMTIIEATAEKAEYLSKKDFISLAQSSFQVVDTYRIQEVWYAPTICGFALKKKEVTQ